jgi:glycosyltransferase involved in cell wall biosynthesis
LRVVYLHQYFTTPTMSGGTRSFELGRRLVDMGHEVHVVTSWREDHATPDWFETVEHGLRVHWVPVRYSNRMGYGDRVRAFVAFAMRSASKAAALQGDVIFATSTPLTIAIPAIWASRRSSAPMVFEVRDSWPTVPVALGLVKNPITIALARALEWAAYHASAEIVVLSPPMADDVVARGYDRSRVTVIPNGCDLDLLAAGRAERLLDEHPWIRSRPIVAYVGAIGKMNGVDVVVDLATALRAHGNPFTFVVVGDGRERGRIEAEAAQRGLLNDTVRFIGPVPKTEVAHWLHASIATLMTLDGPPEVAKYAVQNKFFDSLAAGRPVLANLRGYVSEIAEAEGAGLILDSDPARAATELVNRFESGWLRQAGERAAALARSRFSRDGHAKELEAVLHRAVERRRGRTESGGTNT